MSLINVLVYCALAYSFFVTLIISFIVSQGDDDLSLGDVLASFLVTAVIAKVALM